MRKYITVFDDNKLRLCNVLGVFYTIKYDDVEYSLTERINLFTLCFCRKTKEIYTIDYVDLPKRIYNRYQNEVLTDRKRQELEQIGIYPYQDIRELINQYNEYLDLVELKKYMSHNDISDNKSRYNELLAIQDKLSNITKMKKIEKEY